MKPYNKDIYDHIQYATELLWRTAPSSELELSADVTASWKQSIDKLFWETHRMFSGVPSCTDNKTKHTVKQQLITQKQLKEPFLSYTPVFNFLF